MAMPLDHIVIAVDDLQTAIDDYRALGFQVLVGGQHPGRTSHNALVVFSDGAYLEIIAWRGPAENERWYRTLRDHGEGLVDFALLPFDTQEVLAAAQARGLHTLVGPLDGGRVRPDGAKLQWQTARHATPDLPFLCGDISPRALRVPEGPVRVHPNGAQGVATLTVAALDLQATLARYQALLGTERAVSVSTADGVRSATFTVGTLRLTIESPDGDSTAARAQALREHLASRGEGPTHVGLIASAGTTPPAFDTARSHRVSLAWAPASSPSLPASSEPTL